IYLLSFVFSPTPYINPLSLHDALPIFPDDPVRPLILNQAILHLHQTMGSFLINSGNNAAIPFSGKGCMNFVSVMPRILHSDDCRSEEHTSELQSRFDLVCRLLLEKKNY